MSSSPPTEAPATPFVCACDRGGLSACEGFGEYEGTGYCVLHYPGQEKCAAFAEALKRKLADENFDFVDVWFPELEDEFVGFTFGKFANFSCARFTDVARLDGAKFREEVWFNWAVFNGPVRFISTEFEKGASFQGATFKIPADAGLGEAGMTFFGGATFGGRADFREVTFGENTHFSSATFGSEADFTSATFDALADFSSATFKDYVRFAGGEKKVKVFGDGSSLDLQFAGIEKPERVAFHTVKLRPHWFVNVDARGFEFINVDWRWRDLSVEQEIKSLGSRDVLLAHRLLAIACRNLAINAEENHRYEEASRFRYLSMDARRLEKWRGFAFWKLDWWYWLASGYGESMRRALVVLLGVLVLFAAVYLGLGFPNWGAKAAAERMAVEAQRGESGAWSQWPGALLYSLGVMTLQKPEPRPATDAAQAVVMLETILGPVQAALLALAIRRKFMR